MSEEIKKQDGCSICGGKVNPPATCAACKAAFGSLTDAVPTEWADLSGLEGRELRDRLNARAFTWGGSSKRLECLRDQAILSSDRDDLQILIDLIRDKELAVTQEAERMWEAHLDSFEHYLGQPGGTGRIVAELGHEYLPVIVDRAAEKRLQPRKPDAFGGVDFDGVPHGNLRVITLPPTSE